MRVILTSVIVLLSFMCIAQDYDVRISKITDETGMNIPSTFGIVEDRLGFIWFGTVEGLYRYDGQRMKIYRPAHSDTNSISSPTIRTLLYDSTLNNIFIGTQNGGLNILDLDTEQFTHFNRSGSKGQSLNNNNVWSLMLDVSGKLWIGMEDSQLAVFNPNNSTIDHISIISKEQLASKGSCTIRMLFQDSKGNVYVGTDRYGIFIFDSLGGRTNITEVHTNGQNILINSVLSATEDENGIVWIATYGGGLLAYNPKLKRFVDAYRATINEGLVSELNYSVVVNKGELWVGTEYGISNYNFNRGRSQQFQQNLSKKKSLTDNRIRVLFFDSKGILWIGSEAGVDKLIQSIQFKVYQHDITKRNTLPKGITRSLYKDSGGNIWIGLIDKGLVKFDPQNKKYYSIEPYTNEKGQIVGRQISFIKESKNKGLFWVGDWDNGLLSFDADLNKYSEVLGSFSNKNALTDNRIQTILEDTLGILWIATENGINRYNPETNSIQYIKHNPFDSNSISGNAVQSQAFIRDKKGNFWIGTWSDGLNYLSIESEEPLRYKVQRFKDKNSDMWSNMNHVISLYEQNDSILWIGTFGYGLYKYNINSETLLQFDITSGLWSNIIFGILPGENNTLWLSTDHGLSVMNLDSQKLINYDVSDGLQDNHFFWGAAHKASDGELFFGGINGFNCFYPEDIQPQQSNFNLHLTEVRIFNELYASTKSIDLIETLNLDYDQNFITLEYALLDYTEPTKNLFRVKLEGLESDWNNIGKLQSVNYSNLKPGKYTFIVQAIDSQGVWGNQTRTLNIHIKKPWWQEVWAIVAFIILAVFFVYSVYAYRVRSLERQKKQLSVMVKERTREISQKNKELQQTLNKLAELKGKAVQSEKMASIGMLAAGVAHEINNPINFISGGITGFEEHLKETNRLDSDESKFFIKIIKEGVSRVVEIVSSLNQFSRTNDSFNESCDIHEILNNCLLMLNNLIKDRLEVIKNYSELSIVKGNSGKLHQAFLNILSNAVQAIPETGIINITTIARKGYFEIEIADTGIGIKKENLNRIEEPFFTTKNPGKGTGLGLSLTNQILSEHNGSMKFVSEEGKGTSVKIVLPMGNES